MHLNQKQPIFCFFPAVESSLWMLLTLCLWDCWRLLTVLQKWMKVTDAYLSTDFFPPDDFSAYPSSHFPSSRTEIWHFLCVLWCMFLKTTSKFQASGWVFTQVRYSTKARYLYFTWTFLLFAALYFDSTSQRHILYFLLHYICQQLTKLFKRVLGLAGKCIDFLEMWASHDSDATSTMIL